MLQFGQYRGLKAFVALVCLAQLTAGGLLDENDDDDEWDNKATSMIVEAKSNLARKLSQKNSGWFLGEQENYNDFIKMISNAVDERSYDRINQHLVKTVKSTSARANIAEAKAWKSRLASTYYSMFYANVIEAVDQFIALEKLNDHKCTLKAYAILKKNHEATKNRAHSMRPSALKRVESVIYEFAVAHAEECLDVYPDVYEEIYSKMDKVKVKRVETIMKKLIDESLTGPSKTTYYGQKGKYKDLNMLGVRQKIKRIKSIKGKKNAQIIHKAILELGRADKDQDIRYLAGTVNELSGELEVDVAGLRRTVHKYLIEPCNYYIEQLGPNVYIPARYDEVMIEQNHYYEDRNLNYSKGSVFFHLCKILMVYDRLPLIQDMIPLAEAHVPIQYLRYYDGLAPLRGKTPQIF